jgi:hypothetical protein
MDIGVIPQICGVGNSISTAGKVIDQLCQSIATLEKGTPDFGQREAQINNLFDQIENYKDQLKNLLG